MLFCSLVCLERADCQEGSANGYDGIKVDVNGGGDWQEPCRRAELLWFTCQDIS